MTGAQVLVVEDERIVARAIQAELQSLGYRVPAVAASGEEAIEKAVQTHPDIILMDIVLKGQMDGIEAAGRLRQQLDVPVVYLTAYGDGATLERAKGTEPFGYLLKPYEEKELETTIEMALFKHRIERKLKETNQWLSATLRSIDDAVIVTDSLLTVRLLNRAAEQLIGTEAAAAHGMDVAELCRLGGNQSSDLLERALPACKRAPGTVPFPAGTELRTRGGPPVAVEGGAAPLHDEHGVFSGVVIVLRDISARQERDRLEREAEEERRYAQKMEAVSRLARGVAHEFNNLLTVIVGHSALALAGLPAADPRRNHLAQVATAAGRAGTTVKQLLQFSARSELHPQVVNPNDLLQSSLATLRPAHSPVTIDFEPAASLWAVQADLPQLTALVAALVTNALEAMPEAGRLRVETADVTIAPGAVPANSSARAGDFVRLRFSDTGRGIAPEHRARLFEPFFTTKANAPGHGLGLALAYGIVQEHRGWIECHSEPGRGTRFDVYLPRYWTRVEVPAATPALPAPRPAQATLLVVDDEPMIRELARIILEGHGYRVLLASDGVEAIRIFQSQGHHIDLVILDLNMPRMSGNDTLRQLLELDPRVRVLFSSGYFAEDMTTGEHVLGFISKPFSQDELANMVHEALAQNVSEHS